MARQSGKRPDMNEIAARVVGEATQETPPAQAKPDKRNAAAVELGRRGGIKGGKARAAALTKKQRSEIARVAAAARWKKKR